jgi:hypothetical protein
LRETGLSRGVGWYYLVPAAGGVRAWTATLGGAGVLALVYFLAAQLGLALLSKPSDVAAFWPASGIAAGILTIVGRRARSGRVLLGWRWLQNGSYRRKLTIDWREIVGPPILALRRSGYGTA